MNVAPEAGRWLRPLLLASLVAGSLDLAFALTFWGMKGVPPIAIVQSIASGVLGREAFAGGLATALLGVVLHYGIVAAMAAVYFHASDRIAPLRSHAVASGLIYGAILYGVMDGIVVPLSAAAMAEKPLTDLVIVVLAHMGVVGVPIALVDARRAPAAPVRHTARSGTASP